MLAKCFPQMTTSTLRFLSSLSFKSNLCSPLLFVYVVWSCVVSNWSLSWRGWVLAGFEVLAVLLVLSYWSLFVQSLAKCSTPSILFPKIDRIVLPSEYCACLSSLAYIPHEFAEQTLASIILSFRVGQQVWVSCLGFLYWRWLSVRATRHQFGRPVLWPLQQRMVWW